MNWTDIEIKQLIRRYERRVITEREKYQKKKDDPEFIKQNRERASTYYYANKDKKLQQYQDDKVFYQAKNLLRYWQKNNKDISQIEHKHPDKYQILKERGLL